ncbi:MAG: alpha/beta hydrolase domain-containing protein [Vicinamibacterales bacterium]
MLVRPAALALALCTSTLAVTPAIAASKVPGARQLPITADSYPFGAADHTRIPIDLRAVGYIEEELLIAGTANVYDWPAPGPAVVRTANVPYVTRVLIRRPRRSRAVQRHGHRGDAEPLESLRSEPGMGDLRPPGSSATATRGSASPPSRSPSRHSRPSTPRATRRSPWRTRSRSPIRRTATPSPPTARETENGLVWDIHTQVGAWLRSRTASNPLLYGAAADAAHPVQRLYAWGYSQTGSFLYTYINAVHPLVVRDDGKSMFDAYLVAVASGPTPINQCAPAIPAGDPRRFIRDAGVPIVRVMSQSDYLSGIAARRPDSDVAPDLYRNYEIAGSGHATPDELNFAAAPADIEKGGRAVPPMACNEGPRSRFPNGPAFNAILRNLDVWVRTGTPPPHAESILVQDGKPVLDRFGNVIGGIRSPFVEAPTSTWFGNSTGPSFCRIRGTRGAVRS